MVATKTCVSEKFSLKIQFFVEKHHGAPENWKLIELPSCKIWDAICPLAVLTKTTKLEQSHLGEDLFLLRFLIKKIKTPCQYNTELYKRRNEVECFFLRIKCFCEVFTRYNKLDITVTLALTFDVLFMWTDSNYKSIRRYNRKNSSQTAKYNS